MTATELESYRKEIANELSNVQNVKVLNMIRNLIRRSVGAPEKVTKSAQSETTENSPAPSIPSPNCYTTKELKERIINALESYKQGIYFVSNKSTKETIKWTENAHNDSEAIINYIKKRFSQGELWKFITLIDSALEMILFNYMSGRKDPQFADMCDGNIRCIKINKHSKLIYIKMPDCILILAIYCLSPLDSSLKLRK